MRIRKLLISLSLASFTLGSLAGGVGASPNENANCIGEQFQFFARQGLTGETVSAFAQAVGGIGQFIGPAASADCGAR